ncbi:MAG: hypothetical protein V9F00_03755 [Nocardioides sp.]
MTNFVPIPGDPDRVASGAREMQEAARIMSKAAAELRQIADSASYRSQAIDEFRGHAGELATTLTKASMRYSKSGDALAEYAPKLRAGQEDARDAIRTACSVDVGGAAQRVEHYREEAQQSRSLQDHEEVQRNLTQLSIAQDDLRDQQATLKAAAAQYAAAVRAVQDAAANAADRIKDAEEVSQLNDNLMDDLEGLKEKYIKPLWDAMNAKIRELLVPFLKIFSELMDVIADTLSTIALTLAVIAVLLAVPLPGIAAIFGSVAIVVGLLAVGVSTVSLISKLGLTLLGAMTPSELFWDGLLVGLSVLIKIPMGRKLVKGLKKAGYSKGQREYVQSAMDEAAGKGLDWVSEFPRDFIANSSAPLDLSGSLWSAFDDGTSDVTTGVLQAVDSEVTLVHEAAQISAGTLGFTIDNLPPDAMGPAHQDVGALVTDFSQVNVDQILQDAFGAETVENRGMTCTAGTSHAGGGW